MNHITLLLSGYMLVERTSGIWVTAAWLTGGLTVRVIISRLPRRIRTATSVSVPVVSACEFTYVHQAFIHGLRTHLYGSLRRITQIRQSVVRFNIALITSVDPNNRTRWLCSIDTVMRDFVANAVEHYDPQHQSPFPLDLHRPQDKRPFVKDRYVESHSAIPHRTNREKGYRDYDELP